MTEHPLIAFLEARLAEDEQVVQEAHKPLFANPAAERTWEDYALFVLDDDYRHNTIVAPEDRVLADVKADRDLIAAYREAQAYYAAHRQAPAGEAYGLATALKIRVARFAAHPDYPKDQP